MGRCVENRGHFQELVGFPWGNIITKLEREFEAVLK